ncbi:type II secretion system major pseudopilin GspG [Idiomarina seosinensis]|uniref:Type II secretion system core protein G n=1 Tax=Idiomarina seosinensis TaxID=281739 RepID=A0A432ZCT8_9GAMM|nr:type II secretion system major pseudopilin GspG [Idiomarina seosinensis]RUO75787.1 type II secretion system protein GspG [Idiomarina seosinensis]
MKGKSQGFSLVEVMVVIAIIGILATMVLPNVLGNQQRANEQKVIADIVALENALAQYHLDNSSYPTTEQGLEALVERPNLDPQPRNYRQGGYIRRLPQDPYGNDYLLLNPGEYSDIDIFSPGPDGQPGTDDDFGSWMIGEQNSN